MLARTSSLRLALVALSLVGIASFGAAQTTIGGAPGSASAAPRKAISNPVPTGTTPHGAPEISPSLAAAGLFLLLGGTVLLVTRRRKATA